MARAKFKYHIVDVWANLPSLGDELHEVKPLLGQRHSSPFSTNQRCSPDKFISLINDAGISQICLSASSCSRSLLLSNEEVAVFTRAYPTRIFGLATVNLHDPMKAVTELEHYVKREGFVGLKIVPWPLELSLTDACHCSLFLKCIELDIPLLTQVGRTESPCPSETVKPVTSIDRIAQECPNLKIIIGLTKYQWTAELIDVAWKHKNVYIHSSAWSPKSYPPAFIHFANTKGRKKCMFGTSFPQLGLKDCIDQVHKHVALGKDLHHTGALRKECLQDFMGGNAIRVLKLPPVDLKKLKANL